LLAFWVNFPSKLAPGGRPSSSFETSYSVDYNLSGGGANNQVPQPYSTAPFLLHTPTEPPSRLDPSLDLVNWGITLKSRTPRKTWAADQPPQQSPRNFY